MKVTFEIREQFDIPWYFNPLSLHHGIWNVRWSSKSSWKKDNRLSQTKENKFPVENWEGFKEPSGFFVNADYYF